MVSASVNAGSGAASRGGKVRLDFYRNAILPASVPEEEIAHLLDVKLIESVPAN
jgi:hypothetical protein